MEDLIIIGNLKTKIMTAKQYSEQKYEGQSTYCMIAKDAFIAGAESAKPSNVKKLEDELSKVKAELRSLWDTLEDPEECGKLMAGM